VGGASGAPPAGAYSGTRLPAGPLLKDIPRGEKITQAEAAAEKKLIDPNFDKGKYTYSYLWVDADKPSAGAQAHCVGACKR
jgi:hypothetical protein